MPRMDLLGQFAQATAVRVKSPPEAKSYPDPLPAPEAPKLSREGEQGRLRHHGDLHRIQKKLPRCRFSQVRRPCRLRPDRIFTFWPSLRPFVKVNRHAGVGERHQGLDYPGRHPTRRRRRGVAADRGDLGTSSGDRQVDRPRRSRSSKGQSSGQPRSRS